MEPLPALGTAMPVGTPVRHPTGLTVQLASSEQARDGEADQQPLSCRASVEHRLDVFSEQHGGPVLVSNGGRHHDSVERYGRCTSGSRVVRKRSLSKQGADLAVVRQRQLAEGVIDRRVGRVVAALMQRGEAPRQHFRKGIRKPSRARVAEREQRGALVGRAARQKPFEQQLVDPAILEPVAVSFAALDHGSRTVCIPEHVASPGLTPCNGIERTGESVIQVLADA